MSSQQPAPSPEWEPVFPDPNESQSKATPQSIILYIALIALIPIGFVLGGQASSFAVTGLVYLPLALLAVFAYLGKKSTPAKLLTGIWLFVIFGTAGLAAIGTGLLAVADIDAITAGSGALDSAAGGTLLSIFGVVFVAVLLACLGFIPGLRRGLSRVIPIDPDSFVHTIALVAIVGITLIMIAPLLITGAPPLLSDALMQSLAEQETSDLDGLLSTIYTLIWSVPLAFIAVGYGVQRSFRQTLKRVGLVRPSLREVGLAIGVALVLVAAINGLELVIDQIWRSMGWPRTDAEAFGELIAFAFNPIGAIAIGISAGLGEELAVRGVLQPKLGILLSNLFFASLHALQYNWDSLMVVFLVGAAFGVLRARTNTSVSAITHGVYNFTLIMMATYGLTLFQ